MRMSEKIIDGKHYVEYNYRLEHMSNCCGMAGRHPVYPDLPCHFRLNLHAYEMLIGRTTHWEENGVKFHADGRTFSVPGAIFTGMLLFY